MGGRSSNSGLGASTSILNGVDMRKYQTVVSRIQTDENLRSAFNATLANGSPEQFRNFINTMGDEANSETINWRARSLAPGEVITTTRSQSEVLGRGITVPQGYKLEPMTDAELDRHFEQEMERARQMKKRDPNYPTPIRVRNVRGYRVVPE